MILGVLILKHFRMFDENFTIVYIDSLSQHIFLWRNKKTFQNYHSSSTVKPVSRGPPREGQKVAA